MKSSLVICGVFSIAFISACSAFSHVNIPFEDNARRVGQYSPQEVPSGAMVASENVPWRLDLNCRNTLPIAAGPLQPRGNCPQNDGNFVAIAISGGGSRSAVFSAQVLFELQRYGILQHVDVISSVSGGSFTAALYALSCDNPPATCPPTVEGPDRTVWREDVVFPLLERNFILRWFGNWFYPENIARFWFTAYDRSDIMAETLSDNLFDNSFAGGEGFRFQDLNPQRPNLVINATDNSSTVAGTCFYAGNTPGGRNFTFTREAFRCLKSNLDDYPIAYAVAASAAFPGVFNYVTLGVYPRPAKDTKETHYVHLFDGGPSDNLGLISIQRIMGQLGIKRDDGIPKWVILIDAYQPSSKDAYDPDPRGFVDYFGDTNALDSVGNLLRSSAGKK